MTKNKQKTGEYSKTDVLRKRTCNNGLFVSNVNIDEKLGR